MSKEDNFKEKFKLALLSTANAIADDYSPDNDKKNKKKSKIDLFELDKLESRSDFVKYLEFITNIINVQFSIWR